MMPLGTHWGQEMPGGIAGVLCYPRLKLWTLSTKWMVIRMTHTFNVGGFIRNITIFGAGFAFADTMCPQRWTSSSPAHQSHKMVYPDDSCLEPCLVLLVQFSANLGLIEL